MRKLAILAALTLALASRPAEASRCGPDCLPWLTPVAYAMGAGMVGLYGYGIGYYAYNDLQDVEQSTNYYGGELILHGALSSLFVGATIDSAKAGSTGGVIGAGAFAAVHLTLATNGLRGLLRHTDEIDIPEKVITWGAGTVYGINTLYWASAASGGSKSRAYGVVEVAVNAPIGLGMAYLAHDRYERNRGPWILYGGAALVSGAFVAHGMKQILSPRRPQKLDLLGTDIMPTVVSDGRDYAPGFGASGSF